MITKSFAVKQIERLSGLGCFPSSAAAVGELVKALATCKTEKKAASIVDDLLHERAPCPIPGDLYHLAYEPVDREPCKTCDGDGFVFNATKSTTTRCRACYGKGAAA